MCIFVYVCTYVYSVPVHMCITCISYVCTYVYSIPGGRMPGGIPGGIPIGGIPGGIGAEPGCKLVRGIEGVREGEGEGKGGV